MGFTNFFEQFQRYRNHNESHAVHSRNMEAVNTILSSFGNEVYDCTENFAKQDIEYRDLASLTHQDLELLGIRDKKKQDEMLEVFRELTRQDYSWTEVVSKYEAQEFNNKIINSTNSHLESLKMALSAANLKLKLSPSTDTIVDERHFASKCVLDALDELKKITDKIDERLDKLEKMTNINLKKKSDIRFKAVVTFTSIVLFLGICLWRKQFI